MDELFGSVGFAQDDLARKERIENDIGLTALLNGGDIADPIFGGKNTKGLGPGSDSEDGKIEGNEKVSPVTR